MSAFKALVNGTECSGSNPLAQFAKNFAPDKTVQRDVAYGPPAGRSEAGPSQLRNRAFRGPERPQPLEDKIMVEQFFDPQRHEAEAGRQPGTAFRFDEMRRRLDSVQVREGLASQPDWAAEFNSAHPCEFPPGEDWDKIYDMVSKGEMPGAHWRDAFVERKEFPPRPIEVHADFDKAFGQGFDWEEQFALAEREQQQRQRQQQQQHAVGERMERDWEAEFVRARIADGKTPDGVVEVAPPVDLDNFSDFENIWKNLREGRQAETGSPADPLSWEDEFVREAGALAGDRDPDPDVDAEPRGGRYVFERENPFLTHSDPFAEGLRLMAGAGPLQQASLAFEAACQRDPENSLAWTKLGLAQAENEKEDAAIKALETAVELDPRNAEARMSLSVSYINEGHDYKAYCTLERWLAVRYPDVVAEADAANSAHLELSGIPIYDKQARVRDMFLRAARLTDGVTNKLDPDVQVGLGVMFYGSVDYDKAVDCFVAALEGKPTDYVLFNRLGATLANSGRSEEAISAYHRALDIKPTFVRARFNLGVSCLNMGVMKEAAEHFLGALATHQEGEGLDQVNISDNLWDTLRRTFVMMDRRDLAEKLVPGMDLSVFRNELDF